MKNKQPTFKPKSRLEAAPEGEQTQALTESVQNEIYKREKKATVLNKVSAIWTLLTTLYAIASTCLFIAKGWLGSAVSIVLICILAVYVVVFIVLAVMTFKDVKGGAKRVKTYKKLLKIFKAVANIVLLSITAVSMVGMSLVGFDAVSKWVAFIVTFAVAVIQLGLKIAMLAMKLAKSYVAKRFKVEYFSFVDGRKQKKSAMQKFKESRYKDK
ncbi:MAG: hypothetical protein K2N18_00715 [Clostridia bacterium]|nr:hypothetical protein [Clostridia bacterium]